MGVSQGAGSTLVEALVRDGLVTRGGDENDRRLTAGEQRELTRLLDRVAGSLDPQA